MRALQAGPWMYPIPERREWPSRMWEMRKRASVESMMRASAVASMLVPPWLVGGGGGGGGRGGGGRPGGGGGGRRGPRGGGGALAAAGARGGGGVGAAGGGGSPGGVSGGEPGLGEVGLDLAGAGLLAADVALADGGGDVEGEAGVVLDLLAVRLGAAEGDPHLVTGDVALRLLEHRPLGPGGVHALGGGGDVVAHRSFLSVVGLSPMS